MLQKDLPHLVDRLDGGWVGSNSAAESVDFGLRVHDLHIAEMLASAKEKSDCHFTGADTFSYGRFFFVRIEMQMGRSFFFMKNTHRDPPSSKWRRAPEFNQSSSRPRVACIRAAPRPRPRRNPRRNRGRPARNKPPPRAGFLPPAAPAFIIHPIARRTLVRSDNSARQKVREIVQKSFPKQMTYMHACVMM